jgi:hypothetical protein
VNERIRKMLSAVRQELIDLRSLLRPARAPSPARRRRRPFILIWVEAPLLYCRTRTGCSFFRIVQRTTQELKANDNRPQIA